MKRIIQLSEEKWTGDPAQDIRRLAELVSREFDNVYRYLVEAPSVAGTFKSADSPAQAITVANGMVTKMGEAPMGSQRTSGATAVSILLNATIDNPSGTAITKCGFYFGASPVPTTEYDATLVQSGDFSYVVSGLKPNQVYYVQSFIVTALGAVKSGISSFST